MNMGANFESFHEEKEGLEYVQMRCELFDCAIEEEERLTKEDTKRQELCISVQNALSKMNEDVVCDGWFEYSPSWSEMERDAMRRAIMFEPRVGEHDKQRWIELEEMLFTKHVLRSLANFVRLTCVHNLFHTKGWVNHRGELVEKIEKCCSSNKWENKPYGFKKYLIPWIITSLKPSTKLCPTFLSIIVEMCLNLYIVKSHLMTINKSAMSYFGWIVFFGTRKEAVIVDMSPIERCTGKSLKPFKHSWKKKKSKKKGKVATVATVSKVKEDKVEKPEEDKKVEEEGKMECLLCLSEICSRDIYFPPSCQCKVCVHETCMSDWNKVRRDHGMDAKTCIFCEK